MSKGFDGVDGRPDSPVGWVVGLISGVRLRTREDLERLAVLSPRNLEAREALLPLLEAGKLAFNAGAKLAEILEKRRGGRIIVHGQQRARA